MYFCYGEVLTLSVAQTADIFFLVYSELFNLNLFLIKIIYSCIVPNYLLRALEYLTKNKIKKYLWYSVVNWYSWHMLIPYFSFKTFEIWSDVLMLLHISCQNLYWLCFYLYMKTDNSVAYWNTIVCCHGDGVS